MVGPTCLFWYDAADPSSLILDGSNNCSQWSDKSGNGLHLAQASTPAMPVWNKTGINGVPALDFTGTSPKKKLSIASFLTVFQPIILVAVFTPIGALSNHAPIVNNTTDTSNVATIYANLSGHPSITMDFSTEIFWQNSTVPLVTGTPYYAVGVFNGPNVSSITMNGITTIGSVANNQVPAYAAFQGLVIGGVGSSDLNNCMVGEVFAMTGCDPVNVAGAITYINNKWGITP